MEAENQGAARGRAADAPAERRARWLTAWHLRSRWLVHLGLLGFAAAALSGQTEKFILARLGDYLVRDRIEAGLLVYVAATGDSLARLAQAADKPDEWLVLAHGRIDRFSAEHTICNRPLP